MPYKGSKNAVAKWIFERLPSGERLVDLFAGGCAVTHCAMLSGKWDRFLVNDLNDVPKLFCDAVQGNLNERQEWISREDFHRLKDTDPFVRQAWSFGNDGNSYLYGRDLEAYKKAVHMELTANTLRERYKWHKIAVREGMRIIQERGGKVHEKTMYFQQSTDAFLRCEAIERNEDIKSIKGTSGSERLERMQKDYRDVEIVDGDVVYCDIPYRGTGAAYVKGFDYKAFYAWCLQQKVPVYISEYAMPEEMFKCVAERERVGHLSATDNSRRLTERLFVPKK